MPIQITNGLQNSSKMRKSLYLLLPFLALMFLSQKTTAQNLSLGFKAGLGFSSFNDDSELDSDGNEVESFRTQTGFHIGILGRYTFYDDVFGLRFGLIYNQRGGRVDHEGESWFVFNPEDPSWAVGERDEEIRWSNVYLDIPIEGMVRLGGRFEISAGGYVGFLVGSTGSGDMSFSGRSQSTGNAIEDFQVLYDFKPMRDRAGLGSYKGDSQFIRMDGRDREAPQEAGTYFEFAEKDGNYFNWFDVGLTGGLTYFINQGLYVNAQYKYGLNHVIRDKYYISKVELGDGNEFVQRSGNRRNHTLMISMGFAF